MPMLLNLSYFYVCWEINRDNRIDRDENKVLCFDIILSILLSLLKFLSQSKSRNYQINQFNADERNDQTAESVNQQISLQ
jgi:hypothetical protein